jgi:small subunit ribosomal protein S20
MPNTASAKKRLRQDEKKRVRNSAVKTRIKTETKKALAGETHIAFGAIDRAAAKGVIHKNTAARKKSRLARTLASATA